MLLSILDVGLRLRAAGLCAGDLNPAEVLLSASVRGRAGIERAPLPRSVSKRKALERRVARHLRAGHDGSCLLFGVPAGTVRGLLRAWGDPLAVPFVIGLADEAESELRSSGLGPLRGWSEPEARELVEHVVRRRITPVMPRALQPESEGAAPPLPGVRGPEAARGWDQMPRSPSNRPASSRSFTWVRNRAASAPSTIR